MPLVRIYNESNNFDPDYETPESAGVDLRANRGGIIQPGETQLVGTGLYMEIPKGYEGQMRPRSGLALKKGISLTNSPGTVDSDYRGEIGIILINHGKNSFMWEPGDRLAQMVFAPVVQMDFEQVEFLDELDETERGEGGYGSTGVS